MTNLLYNARNFDHDVEALLVNIPNGAQIVVRQTGGYNHHNRWKNHHNQPIKPEALASLRGKRAEVQSLPAVSVERDDLLPPLEVLCEEAFAAAAVWQTEQWS